jgi:hypothetical protein
MARAALAWLLLIALETGHGILRTLLLAPRLGDFRARQVSVFTGLGIIFAVAWFTRRWRAAPSSRAELGAGALWVALTIAFEISLGRLQGYPWSRILEDYDLSRGGLLGLGMLGLFLAPWLARRLGPG